MNKNVTKNDIVDYISYNSGISKKDSKIILETFFNQICFELINGNDVKLSSFGNFVLKDRKERAGRNPKTMEEFKIESIKQVKFKPSKKIKDKINE